MVVGLGAVGGLRFRASVGRGDVRLHADDGFDAGLLRLLLKLPGGVEITMISDCQPGLLELLRPPDQIVDPVRAVEERVLRVAMEMNEGHLGQDSGPNPALSKKTPHFYFS